MLNRVYYVTQLLLKYTVHGYLSTYLSMLYNYKMIALTPLETILTAVDYS